MKDIQLAKKILYDENQKLVVVKDGIIIYKSQDRGIKPMFILATEMPDRAKTSSIADRVIGKGAALLCAYIGIKEVYGELMSEVAIETLEKSNIKYIAEGLCEHIQNRDKTDLCPIEKRSMDTDDPEELLKRIEIFLNSIN